MHFDTRPDRYFEKFQRKFQALIAVVFLEDFMITMYKNQNLMLNLVREFILVHGTTFEYESYPDYNEGGTNTIYTKR